jgi:hypothetical protein
MFSVEEQIWSFVIGWCKQWTGGILAKCRENCEQVKGCPPWSHRHCTAILSVEEQPFPPPSTWCFSSPVDEAFLSLVLKPVGTRLIQASLRFLVWWSAAVNVRSRAASLVCRGVSERMRFAAMFSASGAAG